MTIELEDVKRLKLECGEVLVLSLPKGSTGEDVAICLHTIRQFNDEHHLGWPVLIIADGTSISVIDASAYTAPVCRFRCRCPHGRHHHHHHDARSVIMSLVLSDKSQVPLTASALEADAVTADPSAVITWESDASDIVAITDNGDGTAVAVSGTDGVANITAVATDPDGNVVRSEPLAITVVNGASDTASVTISAGTPEPKPTA